MRYGRDNALWKATLECAIRLMTPEPLQNGFLKLMVLPSVTKVNHGQCAQVLDRMKQQCQLQKKELILLLRSSVRKNEFSHWVLSPHQLH